MRKAKPTTRPTRGLRPQPSFFLPFERTRRLCRRPQQVARTVPFLPSISCSISHFSHPYAGEHCCGRIASPPPLSRQRENATRASEPIEGKPCIKEMSIRRLGDNPPDPCPLPPPGGGLGRGRGRVGEGGARKPTLARISAPAPPPQTPPQSPDTARETRANSRAAIAGLQSASMDALCESGSAADGSANRYRPLPSKITTPSSRNSCKTRLMVCAGVAPPLCASVTTVAS